MCICIIGGITLLGKIVLGTLSYRWESVTAHVVDSSLQTHHARDSTRTTYIPSVTYRYHYNGNEYTGKRFSYKVQAALEKTTAEFVLLRFSPNTSIEIRVSSSHPSLSVIEHGTNVMSFVALAIVSGFGIALTSYLYPGWYHNTLDAIVGCI